ncbi:hypothetical protein [Aquisphaera insulae]|uniref:hypothetical protein n=1 Tax=Aquisphaera insulae TaxID=2712864 RepID=UPI0013EC61D0|nr:hypothetical protein [Aquisphaera insulae]
MRFASLFSEVHTIELSEQWHSFSKEKLASYPNVTCHFGDSVEVLRTLLPTIGEPAVFFLDAHYSGGTTAMGSEEVPLLRELELICRREQKDTLIIDDSRLIGKAGECGYDGDSIYPRMAYDWRNVTTRKIREITGTALHNPWVSWWDKILILRNRALPQGLLTTLLASPFNVVDVPLRLGKRMARATLKH